MSTDNKDKVLLTFRCPGKLCKKVMGKMNDKGVLIHRSSRSGSWMVIGLIKGWVECTFCGNVFHWDSEIQKLTNTKEEV